MPTVSCIDRPDYKELFTYSTKGMLNSFVVVPSTVPSRLPCVQHVYFVCCSQQNRCSKALFPANSGSRGEGAFTSQVPYLFIVQHTPTRPQIIVAFIVPLCYRIIVNDLIPVSDFSFSFPFDSPSAL